jgi:uncharacterized membrane protein
MDANQTICTYEPPYKPPITDISGEGTVPAMAVLAALNLCVIAQGCVSMMRKISGYPKKMWDIVMFYVLAFLSLGSAILYCFSWAFIIKQQCAYFVIESLPAFLYLLSAYAYMTQSISSLEL